MEYIDINETRSVKFKQLGGKLRIDSVIKRYWFKERKNSHFAPFHFFDPPMDLKQPREMTKQPNQKHLYSFESISTN